MIFSVPEWALILANSADLGEMQHNAAFYLGFHCLPKYHFGVSQYTKDCLESDPLKYCIKPNLFSVVVFQVNCQE